MHNLKHFLCFILAGALLMCLGSCRTKAPFASYTNSSNNSNSGSRDMGMTHKTKSKSAPISVNAPSSTNKKKKGTSLAGSHPTKKTNKIRGFSVFERSKKRKKHDDRLFPNEVSHKFRLHESKVSDKKAARMLKKANKESAKKKTEE